MAVRGAIRSQERLTSGLCEPFQRSFAEALAGEEQASLTSGLAALACIEGNP